MPRRCRQDNHGKDLKVAFLGGVVKSAVIPARVGIRINLGPNTTLLVRILDSRPRLRGGDVPSRE